jgi:hypothetical protein
MLNVLSGYFGHVEQKCPRSSWVSEHQSSRSVGLAFTEHREFGAFYPATFAADMSKAPGAVILQLSFSC